MERHYLRHDNIVYWIEKEIGGENFEVVQGFYLASYRTIQGLIDIVTPSLTSLVVRHLESNETYRNKTEAQKALQELIKKEKAIK